MRILTGSTMTLGAKSAERVTMLFIAAGMSLLMSAAMLLFKRWRDVRFFVGMDEELGCVRHSRLSGRADDCASGAQDHLPVDPLTPASWLNQFTASSKVRN